MQRTTKSSETSDIRLRLAESKSEKRSKRFIEMGMKSCIDIFFVLKVKLSINFLISS